MDNNFWNNITRSTVRELARAAGVRTSNEEAAQDLTAKYGPEPTVEFVEEFWPVLRDGWLARSPDHRKAVVARMRELGKGNTSLKVRSKPEQLAYLRTLRRTADLLEVVLDEFKRSGAEERQPPVFVDDPVNLDDQQKRFLSTVRERLVHLDANTIQGFEQAVRDAVHAAMAEPSFPADNPSEAASAIVGAILGVFLLDQLPASTRPEPYPYQQVLLDRIPARFPDAESVERLFRLTGSAVGALLTNRPETMKSVASWAPHTFLQLIAFDDPDDAPAGFTDQMLAANVEREGQLRAESRSEDPAAWHRDFDEDLTEAMSRFPNVTRPRTLDDGSLVWNVYMGSAMVTVVRSPLAERVPPSVRFVSPLVRDVQWSEDLSQSLNSLNAKEYVNKFYWRENVVWMEHVAFFTDLDEGLFKASLVRFCTVADHSDTVLRDRFGGAMAGHDQEAVFDA